MIQKRFILQKAPQQQQQRMILKRFILSKSANLSLLVVMSSRSLISYGNRINDSFTTKTSFSHFLSVWVSDIQIYQSHFVNFQFWIFAIQLARCYVFHRLNPESTQNLKLLHIHKFVTHVL